LISKIEIDPNTRAILDAVAKRVLLGVDPAGVRVLDVGCGEGRLLGELQSRGVRQLAGVGWNISVPPSAVAFEKIDLSLTGWAASLKGLRYDWVVSTEVIEHLVNPFQYLCEMRRVVTDEGRLLLTFPNVHNLRSMVGYLLAGRYSGFFGSNFNQGHPLHDQHIFIPNLHLVRYFLRLVGFVVEETIWINGKHRLTSQTTLLVARPCAPVALI
jgi:2-polyprenyl-3-methyl-5-hydroxy-6-metoxy-1,4-benzoquinol methylase